MTIPETTIFVCVLLGMALTAVVGILICPAPDEPDDGIVARDITDWEDL